MDFLIAIVCQYFAQIDPFLKINFSPIYDVINEIIISQEHNVSFQRFVDQNCAESTAI